MKTETLHTCPTCGTTGFTARGLKAHRCGGQNRNPKPISAAPGGGASPAPGGEQPQPAAAAPGTLSRSTGVPPATHPNGAAANPIPLADMSVPQLVEAGQALDRAGDLHENTAGICRLLHGLVLLEAKRKLSHGKFQPWVKKNFPRSYREAVRRMRAAEDFIDALNDAKRRKKLKLDQGGKSDTPVTFDAQQLLLADLASNLAAVEQAKLDMSNPVVAAAARYVGERSWTQLLLDLGPTAKGGARESKEPPDPDQQFEMLQLRANDQYKRLLVDLDEFFLTKRGERFDLIGDHDRMLITGLLADIAKFTKQPSSQ